jgi:hypothetical protein
MEYPVKKGHVVSAERKETQVRWENVAVREIAEIKANRVMDKRHPIKHSSLIE